MKSPSQAPSCTEWEEHVQQSLQVYRCIIKDVIAFVFKKTILYMYENSENMSKQC